ncbi:MAG: GH3 auxin-responsive promoter family protein, partial [Planctomycetaceae bacterium]|nr:GH3 auxin-responsive promoter family protein [Planctomycetaceae bacterium]
MSSVPLAYRVRAFAGGFLRRSIQRQRGQFLADARKSAQMCQHQTLQRLLTLNADSEFSRDFHLRSGMSVEEFRRSIPVSDYELVRPYIDRMKSGQHKALLGTGNELLMYAVTSGTTAESRLIPVTTQFVADYRRGWQSWGLGAYTDHSALLPLNMVQLTSSHRRFFTEDQTPCGNISGLVAAMQRKVVQSMYTIPPQAADVRDAFAKRYLVVRLAAADPYAGMLVTANPSTIIQMMELLQQRADSIIDDIRTGGLSVDIDETVRRSLHKRLRPRPERARQLQELRNRDGSLRPAAIWPHLQLLGVWCGGSAGSYVPPLRKLFDGLPVRDHGLHASEGRMTMPIEDNSPTGILEVQTHFFEFIPVNEAESANPIVLEAHELQEGQEYFILLTTSSGLYRYNIRDVVRCTGFYGATPMLEFRHKGAHISSITGEKIAESQVVEAVQQAARQLQISLRQFTLTPEWGDPPGYSLFVDVAEDAGASRLAQLATESDQLLRHG